jgi:hypothetical protein
MAIGAVLVFGLREATLSTHQPVPPDSILEVVLEVETRGEERTQSAREFTDALVATCRLEINSDPVGPVEPAGPDLYRFAVRPSLDQTDRRQFRGCLEDWTVDHVLVDVMSMEEDPVG